MYMKIRYHHEKYHTYLRNRDARAFLLAKSQKIAQSSIYPDGAEEIRQHGEASAPPTTVLMPFIGMGFLISGGSSSAVAGGYYLRSCLSIILLSKSPLQLQRTIMGEQRICTTNGWQQQ
jgi:hypothetical protein